LLDEQVQKFTRESYIVGGCCWNSLPSVLFAC
jgi:hypothetical protein